MLTLIVTLICGLIGIIFGICYIVAAIVFLIELVKAIYVILKKREYIFNIAWYVPLICMIISCIGMFGVELILFHTFAISHLIGAIFWYSVYMVLKYSINKL